MGVNKSLSLGVCIQLSMCRPRFEIVEFTLNPSRHHADSLAIPTLSFCVLTYWTIKARETSKFRVRKYQ